MSVTTPTWILHICIQESHPHHNREMENRAPTKGIPFGPQDDHKLYSQDSQLPAAQHKT